MSNTGYIIWVLLIQCPPSGLAKALRQTPGDSVGLAAVNPDLFLSTCAREAGYVEALGFISGISRNQRRRPEELHVRLGRAHPLAVQAHRSRFSSTPMATTHNPPAVLSGDCAACIASGQRPRPHRSASARTAVAHRPVPSGRRRPYLAKLRGTQRDRARS